MPPSDDFLEVYHVQENDDEGEEVPETVEKLIVDPGVEVLFVAICYDCQRLQEVVLPNNNGLLMEIGNAAFAYCKNLVKISNICNTVQYIGEEAFRQCESLRNVEFEISSKSSPRHQLETIIDDRAFRDCYALSRIKLPASVTSIGDSAFCGCQALIEAKLSSTGIRMVWDSTFALCYSLQTVSLPKTLRQIGSGAFEGCSGLVTVALPLDMMQPIEIGTESFGENYRLANLLLPKGSTATRSSFSYCTLLTERYGEDSAGIVAGLVGRFDNFPIHRLCYDHHSGRSTAQELRHCIAEEQQQQQDILLVDEFGMNPFHILFSTIDPCMELLQVLLESLPNEILKFKDVNGRRPLDYLVNNWTDVSISLVQTTLKKSMIDPLAHWGATTSSWMETIIQSKVQDVLLGGEQTRTTLCNELYSTFEYYENVQVTSILEMVLWKQKLKADGKSTSDGISKQQAARIDRDECRCLSGSDVVIPRVASLLGIRRSNG